jgi:hypothetical protein
VQVGARQVHLDAPHAAVRAHGVTADAKAAGCLLRVPQGLVALDLDQSNYDGLCGSDLLREHSESQEKRPTLLRAHRLDSTGRRRR